MNPVYRAAHTAAVMRELSNDGYHDRMRGVPRSDCPRTAWMQSAWLDGFDSADGVLYDRAINSIYRTNLLTQEAAQ